VSALGNKSGEQLLQFIERVERIQEDIDASNDAKKETYSEAKANGFDTKTMKRIVQLRKMDPEARREAAALLETYCKAIGLE
jgi:uncharacterized protein (UPF0335 family)